MREPCRKRSTDSGPSSPRSTISDRPWRWSRLLWTYLPPALPIVGTFDGIVSCLRTYSKAELKELVRGLDTYDWEIGDFRGGWSPLRGSYLIGVPRFS